MGKADLKVGDQIALQGHVVKLDAEHVVVELCVLSNGDPHPRVVIDIGSDEMAVISATMGLDRGEMAQAVAEMLAAKAAQGHFEDVEAAMHAELGTGPGGTYICDTHGWTGIAKCPRCLVR